MRFELTRAEHIGLAGQRLNHSAKLPGGQSNISKSSLINNHHFFLPPTLPPRSNINDDFLKKKKDPVNGNFSLTATSLETTGRKTLIILNFSPLQKHLKKERNYSEVLRSAAAWDFPPASSS